MTDFLTNQNSSNNVDRLVAQHQVYATAKNYLNFYLILSIPVIISFSFLNIYFSLNAEDYIALFAIILTVYEAAILRQKIVYLKETAAKIQENFDCSVYEMEWNNTLCGEKDLSIQISKYASKFLKRKKNRADFVNWYTESTVSMKRQPKILLCQKENLGWDIELRNNFVKVIFCLASFVVIISLVSSFYFETSLKSIILLAVIPSWPAVNFAITNYFETKKTIFDKKALKTIVDNALEEPKITAKHTRNIQNQIFLNRRDNSLIFDWFYKFFKNRQQKDVSYSTQRYVEKHKK